MRDRDARWLAVYGAYVAAQAHERMRSGLGYDGIDMSGVVEDAATVADDAEEAFARSVSSPDYCEKAKLTTAARARQRHRAQAAESRRRGLMSEYRCSLCGETGHNRRACNERTAQAAGNGGGDEAG